MVFDQPDKIFTVKDCLGGWRESSGYCLPWVQWLSTPSPVRSS